MTGTDVLWLTLFTFRAIQLLSSHLVVVYGNSPTCLCYLRMAVFVSLLLSLSLSLPLSIVMCRVLFSVEIYCFPVGVAMLHNIALDLVRQWFPTFLGSCTIWSSHTLPPDFTTTFLEHISVHLNIGTSGID